MRKKKFILNDLDEETRKELEEGSKRVNMVDVMEDQSHAKIYFPAYNRITGGVLSSILLLQAVYWWGKSGKKKFYKFRDKCKHPLYAEGDSWCEELGFTESEFDGTIKEIGFKLGKTQNKIKEEEAFIIYFKDPQGVTWYDIRVEYLDKSLTFDYLLIQKNRTTNESGKTELHNTNTNAKSNNNNITNQELVVKEVEKKDYSDGGPNPVLLTEKEAKKLVDRFGREDTRDKIDELSRYSKYDKYHNHYSALTNWLKKDKRQEQERKSKTEEEEFAPDSYVNLREQLAVVGST